jgi:hypothetical protein
MLINVTCQRLVDQCLINQRHIFCLSMSPINVHCCCHVLFIGCWSQTVSAACLRRQTDRPAGPKNSPTRLLLLLLRRGGGPVWCLWRPRFVYEGRGCGTSFMFQPAGVLTQGLTPLCEEPRGVDTGTEPILHSPCMHVSISGDPQ